MTNHDDGRALTRTEARDAIFHILDRVGDCDLPDFGVVGEGDESLVQFDSVGYYPLKSRSDGECVPDALRSIGVAALFEREAARRLGNAMLLARKDQP